MKKMLAVFLAVLTLALSGCSALGAMASLVPGVLNQSASETPFPSTVQSPLPSHSAIAKSTAPAGPSKSVSPAASPSPTRSSTQLNPGDVIQTVQSKLPIGLQFLIQQIQSLVSFFTGQASAN